MLKQRIVKALAWQTVSKFITQVFSFGVTIILARLLLPEDYGLVGMALVFTGFIELINEMGIGSSIIRRVETSDEELSSIFWFALMVSGILYLLIYLTAPFVAWFFNNDSVTDIVRVLGLNLIIGSLRTVPFSLLSKELLFSQRSRAEIASAIVGGGAALLFAYAGFGVWSLVFNSLISSMVLVILCFWFSSWRPHLFFRFSLAREMVSFGAKIMVTRMQWYAYSNADYFIVGRLLGKDQLGHYTMAFRLAMLPTEKITAIVNQVMFPTFSLLQDDKERLRQAFVNTTRCVSLVTFPLMSLLVVFAPEIVLGLLTEKWMPAVYPLRVLCLIGLIKSVDVIFPQVLLARGKASMLLKYSTLLLCVLPAGFAVGAYMNGIHGVASAWLLTYPCLVSYVVFAGLRELEFPLLDYFRVLQPQIVGVSVMALFLFAVKPIMLIDGALSNMVMAIGGGLTGFAIYGAYIFLFHRKLVIETIGEIKGLRDINS